MRTFVALDIETTGLDPEVDRVTEVGAVRFDAEGRVLEEFGQLVNPGRAIPPFIEALTGITNEDVRCAPRLPDVAPALQAFVGEGPVVGHNVLGFDLAHLRREGIELPGARFIDTQEFSRILLPERQKRGLAVLAETLGLEAADHHRALPDARTAAAIFAALLRRAHALDPGLRVQLARLVGMENLALAEAIAGDDWKDLPPGERSLVSVRSVPPLEPLVKREQRTPVIAGEVQRVFGAAARTLEAFEERPEQRDMAEAVRRALAEGGHWLIEAGTGVGKSLAYLVPAALHALRNGERVVVSTNTIQLQEQLVSKDIPALREMLQQAGAIKDAGELRVSLLKGRANYLCLRRWVASYGAGLGDPDFARLAAGMLLWLPETETGDRSELDLAGPDWTTWQRFSAQDTDCLSKPGPYVREGKCFLQRARKGAEAAHLVIVNHALLLADVATGGSALPAFDHLVIDEAHNLEDTATRAFGGSVSRRLLDESLDGLHRPKSRDRAAGGVVTLLEKFPEGAVTMLGRDLAQAADAARKAIVPCFEALAAFVPRGGDEDRVLLDAAVRGHAAWKATLDAWTACDRALRDVRDRAEKAERAITETKVTEEPDAIAGEVASAARKAEDLRSLLAAFMLDDDTSGAITWLARERDGTASVNSAPLEVGPRLWDELFAKRRTVVATSATLAASGSMEFAARRMGLESPKTLQLGSPFDYEESTLLAAVNDLPDPTDARYNEAIAAALMPLVRASEGRALALFTSHAALQRVAAIIRDPLEKDGIAVLAQGVDGEPRRLQQHLRENPRTVVLGTQSFWEGVDIRGQNLSLLVITRLPFGVPTDPVHRARSEQHANPFAEYSLPAAILKFRQGFGRLIRSKEDRGVVAVLDRRIFEKRYGEQFVTALPRCTRIKAASPIVAERVREWLEP